MTREELENHLIDMVAKGISEYHMTPGAKPFYRINGLTKVRESEKRVSLEVMDELVNLLLNREERERLLTDGCYELAYSIQNVGRFRMRFGRQRSSMTLVILIKSTAIPSVETLKIPSSLIDEMEKVSGLFIVTGEAKSDKSTTIASLLNHLVKKNPKIVATVENPIDYLLSHGEGLVNQMEVGVDIKSVEQGIKEAMSNHSDIIYLNEVRSKAQWKLVFDALEKGFFVVLSMNSNSVEAALDHLLFYFSADEQAFIKRLLAHHLNAIVCEMNLVTLDNKSCAVYEVLLNNKAVQNMFLENKLKQLPEIFKSFPNTDIKCLDQAIVEAVLSGQVDRDYAMSRSRDKADFMKFLNGVS